MSEINANRIGGLWDGETKHQAGSVWDSLGLAPTIDTMLGGGREPHIMEIMKVNYVNMPETVRIRKNKVDTKALSELLRTHKKISNKEIAEKLNVPITKVEHWFRTDESQSIPDSNLWFKLKEVLGIENNIFDAAITEFEERDGVYEKAERVYIPDSLSPTMTATSSDEKIVEINKVKFCQNYLEIKRMDEIKELGGLEEGSSQRRKVFDENGVSPTLQAAMGLGGGNVPMVVERTEVKELGFIDKGTGKHQSNVVYDKEGLSPCICAALGVKQPPTMTVEQTCVAMRGRNPENPSDRTSGIELEQRLEINNTGCTNTLTTVQKDNLVLEKSSFPLRMVRTEEGKALRKDYEAGNIHHGFNEYREPECRTDGVSNTVTTVQKDTLLLEKEQVLAYDEQNQTIRTETFGTLTTDGSSPKHNNRVIKIKQATKQGFIECEIGGVFCSEYPTSELRRGRVIENGQISPTLTTESIPDRIELGNPDFYNFLYEIDGEIYLIRIRKLIPLECWRLMGFTDEDFKKAEKVNSNTQLYKQAGNSIVCNCLEAIFSQMNIKGITPWNEMNHE